MAESESRNPQHDETIVPVEPGFARVEAAVRRQAPRRGATLPIRLVALGALVVAAGVVFVFLPRWVGDQQAQAPVVGEAAPPEPPAVEGPVYTAAELAAFRVEADGMLVRLLNQQAQLERRSAVEWGGDSYEAYEELARQGDDAYLADAYFDAVAAYRVALDTGEALLQRSLELIEAALDAAAAALAAGNSTVAAEQFSLALRIEPDNESARAGLLRAQQLPEVLALMQEGEALERAGSLEEAVRAYRAAMALDGLWAPARSALTALEARLGAQQYEALMSNGFNALAAEEYDDAHEYFSRALALRPDSRDALDARTQAEQGGKLEQIALVEARAIAFELRERWEDAARLYGDALQTDATLAFAQEGLERAQYHVDLDLKLNNLIENPDLLFDDSVLRDALLLAAEARALDRVGPVLDEQLDSLERLLRLASTPLPVQLQSDEQTEVTLYRVGNLGRFLVKGLELRPGVYTAVGSRRGFRDVRMTFTVIPGQALAPVRVACVEPIQ